MERLQALQETKPPQLKNSNKKKVQGRSKINFQEKNRTNKYCSHHGANKGHNSEECWTLHPELKPKVKGPRLSNNKMKKEINSLARAEKKSELEIVNLKINQLKKAKALYEKKEKTKESNNIEDKSKPSSNSNSDLSSTKRSVFMTDMDQRISKKYGKLKEVSPDQAAFNKTKDKIKKALGLETKTKVNKKEKMCSTTKKRKHKMIKEVSPDQAAFNKTKDDIKRMLGLTVETSQEEIDFQEKAKKLSDEVNLSME